MDKDMRRLINERRRDGARGYGRGRGGYSRSGRGGGRMDRANYDTRYDGDFDRINYDDDYVDGYDGYDGRDGRRGVKGTGPYGIGGRLHYPRRDRASYDSDGEGGGQDEIRLSKRDMSEWKRELENADGTTGAHFDGQQIE